MSGRNRQMAYLFDEGGESTMTAALRGGEGLGLAVLTRMGMPVPYGFTIPTSVCRAYFESRSLPKRFDWHFERCLSRLEQKTGKRLGDPDRPLLLSVRSGAADSMPGMMDTFLNVGYSERIRPGLIAFGGARFANDCKRSSLLAPHTGATTRELLLHLIQKVFDSWNSNRAVSYRNAHNLPHWHGTAVTIQEMVFGNAGEDSCTGVVFSHDTRTGFDRLYGEFLPNAQGEEVVAGTRTPRPLCELEQWNPHVHAELATTVRTLSEHFGHIVDVEFTVERGKLFFLQCRKAKCTARAAATRAVRDVWSGRLERREAITSLSPLQMRELSRREFDPLSWAQARKARFLCSGLSASPGASSGMVVFSAERAREFTSNGYRVVLFRKDTSPDDLPGMLVADAIVTAIGGETSHAAVVARGLNKPAVVGCRSLSIDRTGVFVDTRYLNEGEMVSVSGDTGEVVLGTVPLLSREPWGEVANFLRWMRQFAPQHPRGVPCLRFEYLEQFISMNRVLQDFYLSDAMAKVAERSSLAEEARALRTRIHGEAADMVSCYLAVAVAGEVRHACSHEWRGALLAEDPTKSAYLILRDVYGAIDERRKEERLIAQTKAASQLQYKSLQDPIMFLRACADVFDHDAWGSSYGGRKWSRIARAVVQYLSKEVDATIFVDHAFDLRHNGGALFDKHRMTSSRTCEHHLSWQLEQKKFSTSIEDLFDRFKQMSYGYSEDVSRLWEKGSNCGLWSPRKVHHV